MKWSLFFLAQAAGCTFAVQYNQEFAQFKVFQIEGFDFYQIFLFK